jgi:8-oxo-dGTP diphosphatase
MLIWVPVNSYHVRVVAAVIERDGKVLICQRRRDGSHPFKWEFPGGKIEGRESPAEALQRELEEELAIQARIGPEIVRYEHQYPNRTPLLLLFFRVAEYNGEPSNLQFEEIRWIRRRELLEYDFLEGDMDFVRKLARGEL